jgi:thiamine-phosphate pyrophosphorylase
MKWIVITSPDFLSGEASAISLLLQKGVDSVHLRKPFSDKIDIQKLLEEIPSKFHGAIVLHDHFELCSRYELQGIHLNSRNHDIPRGFKGSLSCSCHSIEEVEKWRDKMNYVFLSPIFNSISKQGYESAFSFDLLEKARQEKIINEKVVALGGVTYSAIPWLQSLSFGGAAFLGDVWNHMQTHDPQGLVKYLEEGRRIMGKN